jgi:hypothetical protein
VDVAKAFRQERLAGQPEGGSAVETGIGLSSVRQRVELKVEIAALIVVAFAIDIAVFVKCLIHR